MDAAITSAGGGIEAINKILNKEWKNAFVITRPPGHHSGPKDN